MKSKLTLSLDEALIRKAKSCARGRGMSLSDVVETYFESLPSDGAELELTPRVRLLYGALTRARLDRREYRKHLEKKYR